MSFLKFANIVDQCAADKHLKPEDISKLEEWQIMQPHLPSPLHPIETALFLQSCFYSMEAAKQCIDAYYTFRTRFPEIFAKRDPFSPEIQLCLNTVVVTILPNLTSDGDVVFYGQFRNRNPDVFNLNALIKVLDMLVSLTGKQNGCRNGLVAILNMQGFSMMHLLKCNINTVRNGLLYLQTALPIRLKAIHYINTVPFMDKIMALIKPFISKEFKDLLIMHYGKNETIFKFLPKDILPVECGGESYCAQDFYNNVTRKEIERHAEFFKLEESQLVDESKRLGKPKDVMHMFGVEGTFKKIDID